jgi:hypothetical protein
MASQDNLGVQFSGQKLYTDPKMQAADLGARATLAKWDKHPETDPLRGSVKGWNLRGA